VLTLEDGQLAATPPRRCGDHAHAARGGAPFRASPVAVSFDVLGVALGVAVVVAVDLASDAPRAPSSLSSETLLGRATTR